MRKPLLTVEPPPTAGLVRSSLRRNFSWILVGNVTYTAAQFAVLIVLARLTNAEMVGELGLALAITAPVMILFNLGLRQVEATDAQTRYGINSYLALRLATVAMALAVILGIVVLTGLERHTAIVVILVGIAKAFEAISDVLYGALEQRERMVRVGTSLIVKGTLSVLAVIVAVLVTGDVLWAAGALAFTWAAVALGYDRASVARVLEPDRNGAPIKDCGHRKVLRPKWQLGELTRLAWLSLPLGIAIMLVSLNTNIPRYFVEGYVGRAALGVYVALTYPLVATSAVVVALGQSVTPRLARHHANGDTRAFVSLLTRMIAFGTALGVAAVGVGLLLGRPLLGLLFGARYADQSGVFVWLLVGSMIANLASVLGFAMTALHLFKVQPVLLGASAATCAAASYVLVSRVGLTGAAWATIAAFAVQAAGSAAVIARALGAGKRAPSSSRVERGAG